MENKNIIVALIIIIVVLATVLGVVFFYSTNAKKSSEIKITSNKTLSAGDSLSVKLTGLNNTAISNETVKITIKDSNGNVAVNKTVKTNTKGKASLDLDLKKGNYNITAEFEGNEKYAGNSTFQKLTVKEEVTQLTGENSVDTTSYPSYSSSIGSYRVVERQQELGVIETPDGRQYVMAGDGIYPYNGRDSQGNIQF